MKKLLCLVVIVSPFACGSGSEENKGDAPSKKSQDSLNMPADTLKSITDTSRAKDTTNRP